MTDTPSQVFLGTPSPVETGHPGTVLLHAPFDVTQFHPGLYSELGVDFPDRLSAAVAKRQADYLAGRALVRQAFLALNIAPQNVTNAVDRAPIWPAGVTGSISHSRRTCACLLSTDVTLNMGIDVEMDLSTNSDKAVRKIALSDAECALIDTQPHALHLPALIFSAKETLFKALYPTVQEFFGFECAEMHDLPVRDHIRLHLTKQLHPTLPAGRVFDVRYLRLSDQYLTWLIT